MLDERSGSSHVGEATPCRVEREGGQGLAGREGNAPGGRTLIREAPAALTLHLEPVMGMVRAMQARIARERRRVLCRR